MAEEETVVVETTEEKVTEIPNFHDADGVLRDLKRSDFPKTKEAKTAYCDYMVQKWTEKAKEARAPMDPKAKAKKQIKRWQDKIAKLEAELAAEDAE